MTQVNRVSKFGNYSLAGTQMRPFERIVVAGSVDLPDTAEGEAAQRVSFRAPAEASHRRFAISLPWAVLLIAVTVAIMAGSSLRKAQTASALKDEFAHLRNKYTASQTEQLKLQEQLSQASDASYICYYAAQNLGMKLAVNEETIQVAAPDTRPKALAGSAQAGSISSRR